MSIRSVRGAGAPIRPAGARGKRSLWLPLVLIVLALALGPRPALAQEIPLTFFQKVDIGDGLTRTLTYRMSTSTPGAPMPNRLTSALGDAQVVSEQAGVYEWTMRGDDTVVLDVEFEAPTDAPERVWRYRFEQVPGDDAAILYDKTTYELVVRTYAEPFEVAGGEKRDLVATIVDDEGAKAWDPGWTIRPKSEDLQAPEGDGGTQGTTADGGGWNGLLPRTGGRMPKTGDLALGVGAVVLALAGCGAFLVLVGLSQRREDDDHE